MIVGDVGQSQMNVWLFKQFKHVEKWTMFPFRMNSGADNFAHIYEQQAWYTADIDPFMRADITLYQSSKYKNKLISM